jgi:hypothetical protein
MAGCDEGQAQIVSKTLPLRYPWFATLIFLLSLRKREARLIAHAQALLGGLQHRFPNPPRAPLHARPILGEIDKRQVWKSMLREAARMISHVGIHFRPFLPFREVMRKSRREVTRKRHFGSSAFLSCLAFRCVLAITRQPILRLAQAREGEAEKLRLSFRYLDRS